MMRFDVASGKVVHMLPRSSLASLGHVGHALSLCAVAVAALVALGATVLSALGVIPWLALEAGFGAPSPLAGPVAQVGVTALLWLMLGTIPSGARMLALERSHREFRMTMGDVARAYHAAHAADRAGDFKLPSEFDAVRERIEHLRSHPDLRLLEADVLTLAAQMSQQSHKLAETYSDERVARARDFLQQRQKEVEDQKARIGEALAAVREIGRWTTRVEVEEAEVEGQIEALDERLRAVLPALGYHLDDADRNHAPAPQVPELVRPDNVVPLGALPAAE